MNRTLIAALALACAGTVQAKDTNAYRFERGYPTAQTSRQARADQALQRALIAYRYWYPTVSMEGIFNGNRVAGIADGKQWGIAATGPRQVGFTLNSDTPYGSAVIDLSKGPVVVELPPGPYIGLVNDHNQGWVQDLGLPGPDAGKGGKHLVVPMDYQGNIPEGYHVGRSPSIKNLLAIRALPVGGDAAKALQALRAVKIHPWSENGAAAPSLETVDTSQVALDSSSLKWEDNFRFWEVLDKVIQEEPVDTRARAMYGLLAELGIEKGKPFKPDAKLRETLTQAARLGRDQMLVAAFDSDRSDRRAWPDRQWEWVGLVPGSAQFETPAGMDMEARDRWFAQAIVTSPAMFRRDPGAGSLYWLGARDAKGTYLDGGRQYTLTLPQPVPGKLFWSVTLYDSKTRSQVQTSQDKAALRSLFELKDVDTSKPLTLYFGPKAPAGLENRWIKTNPGQGWFAYIRIYGPEAAAFDKSWKPGDFERQEK
ncbi:DUF1254 domain-containing protein [Bordetella hinzii]|uniref:Lipoprotein n=1 Tax=Bordetella hinzii TaxID=103855 RepID=A0AAN1RXG2_9BORD|nr:DUF1254 domain-containing protein [Bordetella hinzii]AKQ61533.1 hypothetical protein ACR55_03689 [Bordetella hinzii]AZW17505.1 hypothetical protein CS347_12380 [Bordetella hinzii]KCB46541.1 PF06863 family protein [Bordetella hinzii 4161]KXA72105.1 hypothetical protein AXA74_14905 [Bordetella hinzii LMG 13501]MBZ0076499.1 DUF1254 domain-containing protein [Bordetella hinzii]